MAISVQIKCPTCGYVKRVSVKDENEKEHLQYAEAYEYDFFTCWRASCTKKGTPQKGWKIIND